jgi:hypothetical protein
MKLLLSSILCLLSLTAFAQEQSPEDNKPIETQELNTNDTEEKTLEEIERVPLFKGCDERLDNDGLKKCMNENIKFIVSKNFNIHIAKDLGLKPGKAKISCFFKIDTNGEITAIKIRGPHPKLEAEAIRVLKLIPKLKKPGMQKGKAVIVPYYLPIQFMVEKQSKSNKKNSIEITTKPDTYPVYKGCEDELTNADIEKCTTKKISDFIQLSFDGELASKLLPQAKTTKFQVNFIINKKGKAEKITAKAYNKEIAKEAIKVLKRLPKLKKPAYKDGKPVNVPMGILMTIYF